MTPFVLARIADVTAGRSISANVALAEHSALVAAEVAGAISRFEPKSRPDVAVTSRQRPLGAVQERGAGDMPTTSPARRTVTGPSSLTTMTVASGSSKL